MRVLFLVIAGVALFFSYGWLLIAALKRGVFLEARSREVQRNKRRECVEFDVLPKSLREYVASMENELGGYRLVGCLVHDFFAPGFRGSFSAVYVSPNSETALSISYIRMPRILRIPIGLATYPVVVPFWNRTAENIFAVEASTAYEDGSFAGAVTMPIEKEWFPEDVTIESLPRSASLSEVIAAHNEAANKHLCKFSSQATKIHSLEDLCKTQDALRDKLTEFGAQRMEKLISEACSAELRAELYQFDLPKSDEPSLQSESSGTTGSGSREQSENGAPIPTSQPEQPRPVLNERSLRS